jgi:cleavage and polyadenylation specificity factor subunit 1
VDVCLVMVPISDKTYKKLYAVWSRMVVDVQHYCGLNPRGWGHVKIRKRELVGGVGGKMIVDGSLVGMFYGLGIRQQTELAKGGGGKFKEELDGVLEGCDYF